MSYISETMRRIEALFEKHGNTILKTHRSISYREKTNITLEEADKMESLYAKGLSCYAVGEKLGRDPASVRRVLLERGVQLRNRSQAATLRKYA